MKVVKFRAWNKKTEYMTRVQSVDFLLNGEVSVSFMKPGRFKEKDIFKHEDIILLPYVGIVDYDGRELYEGDIIEYTYKEIPGTHIAAIKYFSDYGAYVLYDGSDRATTIEYVLTLGMLRTEFYIIGNIYENPELINIRTKKDKR